MVLIHPETAAKEQIAEADKVRLFNKRGSVMVKAKMYDGLRKGVVIVEGIHPNTAHEDGQGINTLTSAEASAPHGGACFHDVKVGIEIVA